MSKIEQLISEIEMYLDSCKVQSFSGGKRIVVEKDIIDEMLAELRMQTPEEIRKYQKIISNKDAILADAQSKADSIIDNATKQTEQIVSEHEIMIQAHQRASAMLNEAQAHAQQILDQAVSDANQIRGGAVSYTDNELAMLQNLIDNAISDTENRYAAFMHQLKEHKDVITSNRNQLNQAEYSQSQEGGYHEINNVLNEE
ncbi:MAG: vacuolar family H+-ATPase subunit H [Lachnospiraceae bacterium]|nr:vacuolar family H+-ATPase subunit H [Lachnospiraceae bacterium]